MFAILRDFRAHLGALATAITQLVAVLRELLDHNRELGPALDRLNELELSRHQFEAEVAGALLEAKGKLKAANNSEARERQIKRANDRNADPFPDDGEQVAEAGRAVLPVDAAASQEERLSALRLDVARDPKAAAMNHKWGNVMPA